MKKRLKIAEQILIVLSLALVLPLVIAGAIITNTNQIAVRKELASSANIIADSFVYELNSLKKFETNNFDYAFEAINRMDNTSKRNDFIRILKTNDDNILDFSIKKFPENIKINPKDFLVYTAKNKQITFSKINSKKFLITKTVNIDYVKKHVLDNFNSENRQIYVLDKDKNLLLSKDYEENRFQDIIETFPENISEKEINVFGSHKNQPNVVVFMPEYDWYVVVSSPKTLTYYGIIDAKRKIIAAICIAAIVVFVIFGIYTYNLYINIRQVFKVIRVISDGHYSKKLRFLISPFTSQEVIFIADEFNKMVEKINESYSELNETNLKLKKMDEYKSNLIDTVSHEFRTPLTSIKGYTSSMLRHDVQLDVEARKKSLKIIKNQAERLSRMVEDLLVIPDIEASTLRMNLMEVNLKNVIETSVLSTSQIDTSIFQVNIEEPVSNVYADEDRLIQIFVNLLENALKYSKENTPISIYAKNQEDFVNIKIHNEADIIDKNHLNELFEKFTRVDSNLTRTTRGTGLGLFIVKGLVENMGGEIALSADNGFEVFFTLPVYKGINDENL